MSRKLLNLLAGIALPGGIVFAAYLLSSRVPGLAAAEPRTLHWAAMAMLGAGLLLSTVFRRSRLFFATLVIGLGYASVEWCVPRMPNAAMAQIVVNATAALMAVNLAALSLLRDRGVISPPGLRRLALVGFQVGAVLAIVLPTQARAAQLQAEAAALLQRPLVEPRFTLWSHVSQPVMVVFALAGALLLARLAWRRRPVDNGLFWSLATVSFGFTTRSHAFALYTAAAALIVVIAVVETSYTMAYRDELTELPGRRALNESLLKLGNSYAVGMVDVDHFKKFNDNFGHDAGDQVLRKVASKLAQVGGNGKPFRYGGEEFAVIFSGKSAEEAFVYLDQVRREIEAARFGVRGSDRRRRKKARKGVQTDVTVSVGIAASSRTSRNTDDVLRAADKALYRAKSCGRNCTVAAEA